VDWTPESLIFKYDGKVMFRITKTMVNIYGKWAFDNSKYLILNFAVGGAYPAKINGAKGTNFGLTASSLNGIISQKAKMYVDWVKITQHEF